MARPKSKALEPITNEGRMESIRSALLLPTHNGDVEFLKEVAQLVRVCIPLAEKIHSSNYAAEMILVQGKMPNEV